MLKDILKHILVLPAFILAWIYGLLRSFSPLEGIKSFAKNSLSLVLFGIVFKFYKKTGIIYNGRITLDFSILKIYPFAKKAQAVIEIYPLLDFTKNRKCMGKWVIPLYIRGSEKNTFTIFLDFPNISFNGRVYKNLLDFSILENGKHIAFLRLKTAKTRIFTLHRFFKFYNFPKATKKNERTPLDSRNFDTYSFLFSKPFAKSISNFTSVWNEQDPNAHISNFSIYAFNFISVVSRLMLPPGSWILDLGAGSCWTSEWLSRLGYNVIGYDISLQTLSIGNQRINSIKKGFNPLMPDFLTVCGDSCALPFITESLDAVVVIETLHHVPDYPRVIEEAFRVLKKQGKFALLEPGSYHSETPEALITMKNQAIYEGSLDRAIIRKTALSSGFRVKEYLMPVNSYILPRNDNIYYRNRFLRLYGNVYEWFIRYLEIPLNMEGNMFFIFEKPKLPDIKNRKGGA